MILDATVFKSEIKQGVKKSFIKIVGSKGDTVHSKNSKNSKGDRLLLIQLLLYFSKKIL